MDADINNINFYANKVSGTILYAGIGKSGVSIEIKAGDVEYDITTDSNGQYVVGGLQFGNYTITPTLSGYSFAPANRNITIDATTGNILAQDFTSNGLYTISGKDRQSPNLLYKHTIPPENEKSPYKQRNPNPCPPLI